LDGLEKGYIVYRDKKVDERVRLVVDWNIAKIIKSLRRNSR